MTSQANSVLRIISQSVDDGRSCGLDRLGQDRRAARAIMQVEPDLSEAAALRLVQTLRAD